MLLVNTRTSGNFTSASINEIDPRGGASITGENAVGKTTTLELFPLFFGTLPSQITEAVGGREPMLKFVLPMPYSAIVYEYQCGADEAHDLRCTVLRRTDNDHRPVYRFINGGFREEAFLRSDEQGRQIFCDDKQMVDAYFSMGVECSRQLDIAEYRAVILGTEARTQDAKALRRMSVVYGFGTRLTNLDRLIAAVAKERLDFKDFVRLAITIVQERLNTHGDAPSRQKVTLRQSKDQITRWLRDRSALDLAFGMAKDVGLLRDGLEQHNQAEMAFRAVRLEVAPALKLRRERLAAAQDSLKQARSDMNAHNVQSQQTLETLQADVERAANHKDACANKVREEDARRGALHLSEVQEWARALDRLDQMQVTLQGLDSSAEAMSGKSADIEVRFTNLVNDARHAARDAASRLRASKDDIRSRAKDAEDALRKASKVQEEGLTAEFAAIEADLKLQIDHLVEGKAKLDAQIEAAQPSRTASDAQADARVLVRAADQRLLEATDTLARARSAWERAVREQGDADGVVERAEQRIKGAQSDVVEAQSRLNPADGTLLSALRSHPDEAWKADLAKILDPSLLSRTDLSPTHHPNADPGTAFGWQMGTTAISQPIWSDDAQLRQALAQAESTLAAARGRLVEDKELLQQAAENARKKKTSLDEAQAEHSIAVSRQDSARKQEADADEQCRIEVAELKRNGTQRAQELADQLRELRSQLTNGASQLRTARSEVAASLDEELRQHRDAMNQAIDSIEQEARDAEAKGETSVKSLEADRDASLNAAGVDPVRLAEIRKQANDLRNEIRTITARRPTVDLWRQWLNEGGDQILVKLNSTASSAQSEHQKARTAYTECEAKAKRELERLTQEVEKLESLERKLIEEISVVKGMLDECGLSEVTWRDVDPEQSLEDLRARLNRARSQVEGSEALIRRRHAPIRDQLTGQTSSVADYVQRSLDALPGEMSLVGKAAELCAIYDGLKRQVLPNVINDVTTILNQVRQFRGVITRFESEVNHFNKELQRGLNVAQFHRIESLKVAIVSNFAELSLMREIDEIDKVARAHETSSAVNDRAQLPDAQTASALTKFLQLLRQDSTVELDLAAHVDLKGSVTVNGQTRHFSRPADLEHISSTGINAIILISLLVGMLNMIRGDNDIYIPWISDEVGKFDPGNFKGLMDTLRENRIDPVTASPTLTHAEFRHFARRYVFKDRGSIGMFAPQARSGKRAHAEPQHQGVEMSSGVAHEA
ncbi:ATP-binding protein [Hydrogenophaga soli]